MALPVLKNDKDEKIKPQNLILHNGEGQMIFNDAKDPSQLFNFDLEKGKIIEQFTTTDEKSKFDTASIRHLTNKFKNGQSSGESTFVGINERAIYTLDPRINKKQKMAQEKVYKTNP